MCGVVFFVCRGCDRGQKYSGDLCRLEARRQTRRRARQRHRKTLWGRADHSDAERERRARRTEAARTGASAASDPPCLSEPVADPTSNTIQVVQAAEPELLPNPTPHVATLITEARKGESARCAFCARLVVSSDAHPAPRGARTRRRQRTPRQPRGPSLARSHHDDFS